MLKTRDKLYLCTTLSALGFLVCIQVISSARRSELLLPWYDVSSTGDGISPEVVNYWQVPPKVALPVQVNSARGPVQQDVTKWNGDHALNGGNKEWAEEDGALHAFNMANWRIKVLESQLKKQKLQWQLMHSQDGCHRKRGCGHTVQTATSKKVQLQQVAGSDGDGEKKEVRELERTVKRQARQIRQLERRVGGDSDSDSDKDKSDRDD